MRSRGEPRHIRTDFSKNDLSTRFAYARKFVKPLDFFLVLEHLALDDIVHFLNSYVINSEVSPWPFFMQLLAECYANHWPFVMRTFGRITCEYSISRLGYKPH